MRQPMVLPLILQRGSDQDRLNLKIASDQMDQWCLELCLVDKGLQPSYSIIARDGKLQVVIDKSAAIASNNRGVVIWSRESVYITLSDVEFDYWLHFFLKLYRDGIAEVDHIDLDIASAESKGLFLTLKFENNSSPVSSEEARKRLGV